MDKLRETKNLIKVLKSLIYGQQIASDSKISIEPFEKEASHPIMNELREEPEGGFGKGFVPTRRELFCWFKQRLVI